MRVPRKRRRLGNGQAARLRATKANEVWAIDFQFDETADRRRIKLCNIVDEYTREALAIRVDRTCTAEGLVAVIEDLVLTRGAPEYLRADNGPEMIAWALRDYCRLTGTTTTYIEPGSPWENPFVESLQRPTARRASEHRGVRLAHRDKDHHRGLANRVQHLQTTLSPRRAHAHRIRSKRKREPPKPARPRISPGSPTGTPPRSRPQHRRPRRQIGARHHLKKSLSTRRKRPTWLPHRQTGLASVSPASRRGLIDRRVRSIVCNPRQAPVCRESET